MSKSNIVGSKKRQIKAVFSGIVSVKLATLDSAAGDRLLSTLDALRDQIAPTIVAVIDQFSALPPVVLKLVNASVQLDAIASYDPKGFKTRNGLWVSDDFQSRVGKKAKPVNDLPAITLTSGDLTKNAYDKEIKADPVMPANHVFTSESEFVAYFDQMIQKQSNGEEGDLLTNGYWNIFYVAGCVVRVSWDSGSREWFVHTWILDGGRWDAGNRAFGCN